MKQGCFESYSGNLKVDNSIFKYNSKGEIRALRQNIPEGWSDLVCVKVGRNHYEDLFQGITFDNW